MENNTAISHRNGAAKFARIIGLYKIFPLKNAGFRRVDGYDDMEMIRHYNIIVNRDARIIYS